MLIVLASLSDKIVDPIVNVATDFIGSAGVAGVFVLMLLESACIPVPSEAIMLFAGFSVSKGDMTLFGIVAAGVLGNLVGSWIAYAVGYFARLDLLEKNRLIHISPKHLKWADDWFSRYGDATVFFTRMLPIIRTFISLPAGVAKMPFWRFTAFTLAGCVPWVLMLALVGRSVGDNWEQWRHNLGYLDYVVLAGVVAGVVYLVVRRRRGGGSGAVGEAPGNAAAGSGNSAAGPAGKDVEVEPAGSSGGA
jgi:membrane protein DedA with SNARE-associated domain